MPSNILTPVIKLEVLKEVFGEKQKKEESNNNLSYLLNILDGIQESQGRIIIMTTNRLEFLDKALIRNGRIDIKINFKKASVENIKQIIESFFGESKDLEVPKNFDRKYPHCLVAGICRSSSNFKEVISKLNSK